MLLLLVIAFAILASLFFIKLRKINELMDSVKMKDDTIGQERRKNNQTIQALYDLKLDNKRKTEQLTELQAEMKKGKSKMCTYVYLLFFKSTKELLFKFVIDYFSKTRSKVR